MPVEQEVVKLIYSLKVKDLLYAAKQTNYSIKADEGCFFVRDNMTSKLIFKGIRIRTDLWGVTFIKRESDK